jgi:hypothetical protein
MQKDFAGRRASTGRTKTVPAMPQARRQCGSFKVTLGKKALFGRESRYG